VNNIRAENILDGQGDDHQMPNPKRKAEDKQTGTCDEDKHVVVPSVRKILKSWIPYAFKLDEYLWNYSVAVVSCVVWYLGVLAIHPLKLLKYIVPISLYGISKLRCEDGRIMGLAIIGV